LARLLTFMSFDAISFVAGAVVTYLNGTLNEDFRIRRQVDGLLVCLEAELSALSADFAEDVGSIFAKAKEEKKAFYPRKFVHNTKSFIAYPRNTALIGHIQDPGLVSSIVKAYVAGGDLNGFLIENNRLLDQWIAVTRDEKRGDDPSAAEMRLHLEEVLTRVFGRLQTDYGEFCALVGKAIQEIKHYRESHRVSRIPESIRRLLTLMRLSRRVNKIGQVPASPSEKIAGGRG